MNELVSQGLQQDRLPFSVEFCNGDGQPQSLSQDKEYCIVRFERKIRFHDYDQVYRIPGLYEHLFYHSLQCVSPTVVCGHLQEQVEKAGGRMSDLVILDVGAGNGMVGERLHQLGAISIIGVDIIEEARQAQLRDRPGIYKDYFVIDLTQVPDPVRLNFEAAQFNCLVTIAALGFGDIPVLAFANAYNFVSDGGWIAFNIKEDFLTQKDKTGFSGLIHRMIDAGALQILHQERYRHRLATDGTPLHYVSIIGRKKRPITEALLKE